MDAPTYGSIGKHQLYFAIAGALEAQKVLRPATRLELDTHYIPNGRYKTIADWSQAKTKTLEFSSLLVYQRLLANMAEEIDWAYVDSGIPNVGQIWVHSIINRSTENAGWQHKTGTVLPSIADLVDQIPPSSDYDLIRDNVDRYMLTEISKRVKQFQKYLRRQTDWSSEVAEALRDESFEEHHRRRLTGWRTFQRNVAPTSPLTSSPTRGNSSQQIPYVSLDQHMWHQEGTLVLPLYLGDFTGAEFVMINKKLPFEFTVYQNGDLQSGLLILPSSVGEKLLYDTQLFLDAVSQHTK